MEKYAGNNLTITKAIIPVAGFGTRMYPETRGVKKEFCPVIDKDGLLKPGILILLEELDRIGIERICLILNREEKAYYEKFFFEPLSDAHCNKLNDSMKEYEKKILSIGRKLSFVFQEEQRGFGHAVYQAKDFAADNSVLLLLGDTIYDSNTDIPCTEQLIKIYDKYQKAIVGIGNVPVEKVGNFGIFSGDWVDPEERVLSLKEIYEKPTTDYAKAHLSVLSNGNTPCYYGAFGTYIITKEVFERLKDAIDKKIVNSKGEIELTDALAFVSRNYGMYGFRVDGISYDLGNPEAYRSAVYYYGRRDKQ